MGDPAKEFAPNPDTWDDDKAEHAAEMLSRPWQDENKRQKLQAALHTYLERAKADAGTPKPAEQGATVPAPTPTSQIVQRLGSAPKAAKPNPWLSVLAANVYEPAKQWLTEDVPDAARTGINALASNFADEAASPVASAQNRAAAAINEAAPEFPARANAASDNENPVTMPWYKYPVRAVQPAAVASELTPVAARRGLNAPLAGEDDAEAQIRAENAQALERSPLAAGVGYAAGAGVQSMLLPGVSSGPAASFARKAGTAAANVGLDALAAGTAVAGMSEAPDLRGRLEAGVEGAKVAAPISAAIRSVPLAVDAGRAGLRAARSAMTAGYSEDATEAAQKLFAPGDEGRELRALALKGEAGIPDAQRAAIREGVTRFERSADRVLSDESTGVGMKLAPVQRSIEESGEALAPGSLGLGNRADEQVLEVAQAADSLAKDWRANREFYSNHGAMRKVEDAVNALNKRWSGASADAEQAASAYVALDQLKRDVGKAHQMAVRSGDKYAAQSLDELYQHAKRALENSEVWGNVASEMQRTVNPAWEQFMLTRPMYESEVLTPRRLSDIRSADAWGTVAQGDPTKIKSGLTGSGTEDAYLFDRAMSKHLPASAKLADVLTDWYESPAPVRDVATSMRGQVDELAGQVAQVRKQRDAAGMLRTLREASSQDQGLWDFMPVPSPASQATMLARGEEKTQGLRALLASPRAREVLGAAKATPRAAAVVGASAAAPGGGEDAADASMALAQLERDPNAFGENSDAVRHFAQRGDVRHMRLAMLGALPGAR